MSLQVPSLLAQLPQPLGTSSGKIQFAEIDGIQRTKKRRRYEIAAAVDGEGVNIYSVQFPKLITTYAIPPQASHLCPPCSVRQRSSTNSHTIRRTYCAIQLPEKQIRCFTDELSTPDQSATDISTTSFSLDDTSSEPVFIGTVAATLPSEEETDPFDVIVVHKDGRIRRLSPELKTQRWSIHPNADDIWSGREVGACFTVGFEETRKFLFRKRQDIVASVLGDMIGTDPDSSTIMMLVSHPSQTSTFLPSDAKIHFFLLPARVPTNALTIKESERLKHLMTLSLPNLQGQDPLDLRHIQWNANLASGELSLSSKTGIVSYDISQFSPQISSHIVIKDENFSSIMRISSQSVVGAGQSAISVYDAQYQSLQAELPLSEVLQAATNKQQGTNPSLEFISCFSKLGVAVAGYGNTLLSFDLKSVQSTRSLSRKRPRTSLLIDAIGKGIPSANGESERPILEQGTVDYMRPIGLTSKKNVELWSELKVELDALVAANKPTQFDTIMKSKFGIFSGDTTATKGLSSAKDFVDPEKISFLLSKIFSLRDINNESASSNLSISFLPFETLQYLINSSHLSVANIQTALRRTTLPYTLPTISPGALVQALADSGHSIKLLVQALRGPVHLDAVELAHALKILLVVARSHATNSEDPQKSLTDSSHKETEAQEQTKQGSETALINAMAGLNLALTKLHSQPPTQVSQSIRSTLSNSDILAIVHHLRHSLATGGYTSRFTEEPPVAFSSPKIPTLSLSTIVDLLTACIDAIGPSGWISAAGFAGAAGSEASLIADMKSEISAALAGIEEATYLKGIFREFIRCCETTAAASSIKNSKSDKLIPSSANTATADARIKRTERHNGAEIVVYDSIDDGNAENHASNMKMLPLSLKMTEGLPAVGAMGEDPNKTTVRKPTGEIKTRSSREMGYLKRKAVGKYSFEKIVI